MKFYRHRTMPFIWAFSVAAFVWQHHGLVVATGIVLPAKLKIVSFAANVCRPHTTLYYPGLTLQEGKLHGSMDYTIPYILLYYLPLAQCLVPYWCSIHVGQMNEHVSLEHIQARSLSLRAQIQGWPAYCTDPPSVWHWVMKSEREDWKGIEASEAIKTMP